MSVLQAIKIADAGADRANCTVMRTIAGLLDRLERTVGFEEAARLVVFEGACQLATEAGCAEAATLLRMIADHFDGGPAR